jgi:hypothetical protein
MEMTRGSYRDLEAYRLARTLLADACRDDAPSPRLGRMALTVALHVLDGTRAEEPGIRRGHLEAALRAAEELEHLLETLETSEAISEELALEMRHLCDRTGVAILETLGE